MYFLRIVHTFSIVTVSVSFSLMLFLESKHKETQLPLLFSNNASFDDYLGIFGAPS